MLRFINVFKNRAEKRKITVQAVCRQESRRWFGVIPGYGNIEKRFRECAKLESCFFSTKKRERMIGILRTRARPLRSN